jgi:hypothetical protein
VVETEGGMKAVEVGASDWPRTFNGVCVKAIIRSTPEFSGSDKGEGDMCIAEIIIRPAGALMQAS